MKPLVLIIDIYRNRDTRHRFYSLYTNNPNDMGDFLNRHKRLFQSTNMGIGIREIHDDTEFESFIKNCFEDIDNCGLLAEGMSTIVEDDFMIQSIQMADGDCVITAPVILKEISSGIIMKFDDCRENILSELMNISDNIPESNFTKNMMKCLDDFVLNGQDTDPQLGYVYNSGNSYNTRWEENYMACSEDGYLEQGFSEYSRYMLSNEITFFKNYDDLFINCFGDWALPF